MLLWLGQHVQYDFMFRKGYRFGCSERLDQRLERSEVPLNPNVLTLHFQFDESFLSKYALILLYFAEGAIATLATGTVTRSAWHKSMLNIPIADHIQKQDQTSNSKTLH